MNKINITIMIVILATILIVVGCTSTPTIKKTSIEEKITVFKSASCGCCGGFAQYAEGQGFNVDVKIVDDLDTVKEKFKISDEMRSCHTSQIEDYFIEGHMPTEAIEKLMAEKPDIAGISLPGMPPGSPGMPGKKNGVWTIHAINHDGSTSEFMKI